MVQVVDSRNNVVGMITRKDITHHALDEALLRIVQESSSGSPGTNAVALSAPKHRLVSLDQESAIAATERTRSNSLTSAIPADSSFGRELENVAANVGSE